MLGKLNLQLRQRFGHGVRVAWYRDVVRQRILRTAPVVADDASVCEIHAMTSSADWLNLIWALKTFYAASQRRYALCIHDDGSLDQTARDQLSKHFPQARLLDKATADALAFAELRGHRRSLEFRRTNGLAPKVFDFRLQLRAERMLLLDSDVLFFHQPTELLRRIEDPQYLLNTVNGDVQSAYTVDPADVLDRCDVKLVERFNSGLGLIHKASINIDWLEEFLGLPNVLSHEWRIEQTLFALCSCRFGVELLPADYDVFLSGAVEDRAARHYVGAIRHLMYGEGLAKLNAAGFLRSI